MTGAKKLKMHYGAWGIEASLSVDPLPHLNNCCFNGPLRRPLCNLMASGEFGRELFLGGPSWPNQ
jgi:hypothetical protein